MRNTALSPAARQHLELLTGDCDLDLLHEIDRDTLLRYCESYARWQDSEGKVSEFGSLVKGQSGFPSENPHIGIASRYSAICSKMEAEVKKILIDLRKVSKQSTAELADGDDGDDLDSIIGAGFKGG